jgi:Leucine-rich repeat (LRR) protein
MKNHLFIASMCITFTSIMHAESFDRLEQALVAPEKATTLSILCCVDLSKDGKEVGETKYDPAIKHLPSQLGTLINLVELDISCLENLEDLPNEVGNLKKLEKLIIDNGNACQMNISLPESIGNLSNLKVLTLCGAIDPREIGSNEPIPPSKVKSLPGTIRKLQNLEELDLSRNGIKGIPSQIASLQKLKRLALDYNNIHELPSFIGNLKNLQELSVCSNGGIKLPKSLANLNGLKIFMGNNKLKIKDQEKLRRLFPKATFSFENEYDDSAANDETPK